MICSCTARRWLYKLGYEYKDVRKDIFVNRHERSDVVEDCKNFLLKMEELKPYVVEFKEDGTIKPKAYPFHCTVGGDERQPIIVITHDKCIFSANNGVQRVWT